MMSPVFKVWGSIQVFVYFIMETSRVQDANCSTQEVEEPEELTWDDSPAERCDADE